MMISQFQFLIVASVCLSTTKSLTFFPDDLSIFKCVKITGRYANYTNQENPSKDR